MDNAGIYVHIPFCLKKCSYCDFFSEPIDDLRIRKAYTRALLQEIGFYGTKYGKSFAADSIYFGGGTPSLMEPELILKLIDALKDFFSIRKDCEITLECNPATVTQEKLLQYRKAGVNRLSIGAQSFDDDILKSLGRVHTASDIEDTFRLARKAGFDNISLDLMFAVPDQTSQKWNESLQKALRLAPEHISFYSLEVAEGTILGEMVAEGTLKETSAEQDRFMYKEALNVIEKAGYIQYEISNAAIQGRESRHNNKYWNLSEYLGFGAGAHSYVKGVRYYNVEKIDRYFTTMMSQDRASSLHLGEGQAFGADCVEHFTVNSYMDNVSEYTFTALRTKEGVRLKYFAKRFKTDFWDIYAAQRGEFEKYVRDGYAVSDGSHVALTRKGFDISNKIMALFV